MNIQKINGLAELEQGVFTALETYSNVHRGSGQNSFVTTYLYEQARDIVLDYLGIKKGRHIVIFCSPREGEEIKTHLEPGSFQSISSLEIGLPLGVMALAVRKKALPKGAPLQAGGGTTTIVSPDWAVWAKVPDKFEAGTPSIINIITLARALSLFRKTGENFFPDPSSEKLSAEDILHHDDLEKYSGRELIEQLRQGLIGHNIRVPTIDGTSPFINLDNSASTPAFTPVWNAVRQTWRQSNEIQREIINEVKSICSRTLGAPTDMYDLIFSSNTTEAINLVAESIRQEPDQETETVVLTTILEHTSNDLPWRLIPHVKVVRLHVDAEGFLDPAELERVISAYNQKGKFGNKRIRLMAMSGASNVLGSFNDLDEISRIVHKYGARLLVDAAQLVAHRKIEMEQCCIDYLAFSAHKVYAPFGTGVLVYRKELLNFSANQLHQIKSSGEENAGGIAALGKALILMGRIGFDVIREEEQSLTARILDSLSKTEGIKVYGVSDPASQRMTRKGGVIVFTIKGMMSDKVAGELALRGGIGVRSGCHCAHILVKHILGVPPSLERFQRIIAVIFRSLKFPGVARVSLGIGNTREDVDTFIKVVSKIAENHGSPQKKEAERRIKDFAISVAKRVYS